MKELVETVLVFLVFGVFFFFVGEVKSEAATKIDERPCEVGETYHA